MRTTKLIEAARSAWARMCAPWVKAWEEEQFRKTAPLRCKVLAKTVRDQGEQVRQLLAELRQAYEASDGAAELKETASVQAIEIRAAWNECRRHEAKCDALMRGETASGLSPEQVERLALLGMAAGKLAAEVNKVVLYGWTKPDPKSPRGRPGYVDVESAMGRVLAGIKLMQEAGDVRRVEVRAQEERAKERACALRG